MLQLADKVRTEEDSDIKEDGQSAQESDLKAKAVIKHWGQDRKTSRSGQIPAGLFRQQASSEADAYEARNVSGLKLLSLGAGQMCGEFSLGFKKPESPDTQSVKGPLPNESVQSGGTEHTGGKKTGRGNDQNFMRRSGGMV